MNKRFFLWLAVLLLAALLAACVPAQPVPTADPFPAVPCVRLRVKFSSSGNWVYQVHLRTDHGRWGLTLTDYPGELLPPGIVMQAGEEGREDLPFERFLEVFRVHGAAAWDGWRTKGGDEVFSLELEFADGSSYTASGGDAPEGFEAFREAMVREMVRFGEEYCGLAPQTAQERLLNVNPMFGDEGGPGINDGGISYDVYKAYRAVVPLGDRFAEYHRPDANRFASGNPKLAPFLGERLTVTEKGEWYRVKGCKGIKYLISRDHEGVMRLWIFRVLLSGENQVARAECTAEELLREIYGVEGAEDIRKMTVSPGIFGGAHLVEPEQRLTNWVLEDREDLDAIYGYLTEIGSLMDWRSEEAEKRMGERHGFITYSFTAEGYDLSRYWGERELRIVLADGTTVDKLIYDANCGFLYDYTQSGYCGMLSIEAVEYLNTLFGIA